MTYTLQQLTRIAELEEEATHLQNYLNQNYATGDRSSIIQAQQALKIRLNELQEIRDNAAKHCTYDDVQEIKKLFDNAPLWDHLSFNLHMRCTPLPPIKPQN